MPTRARRSGGWRARTSAALRGAYSPELAWQPKPGPDPPQHRAASQWSWQATGVAWRGRADRVPLGLLDLPPVITIHRGWQTARRDTDRRRPELRVRGRAAERVVQAGLVSWRVGWRRSRGVPRRAAVVFVALAAADTLLAATSHDRQRWLTKPLLMPVLMAGRDRAAQRALALGGVGGECSGTAGRVNGGNRSRRQRRHRLGGSFEQ